MTKLQKKAQGNIARLKARVLVQKEKNNDVIIAIYKECLREIKRRNIKLS